MKTLAIIPARSGSKGVPDKNIAQVGEKTLLEIAVHTGLRSASVTSLYVSTDSKKYEDIAVKAGAKSLGLRKAELATDTAKTIDVVIDLINDLPERYDYIILLQPTSPIRTPDDIDTMLRNVIDNDADAAVSVSVLEEPHPYKLKAIDEQGYVKPFLEGTDSETPRQLLPKAYALNGAVYIVKTGTLLKERTFLPAKTLPYIMETHVNVDTLSDLTALRALHEQNNNIFV